MAVSPTYNTGVTAANYTPTVNDLGAIEKIAKQAIYQITADNRLAGLEHGELNEGVDVEQIVIRLAESSAYDPTSVTPLVASAPGLAVRYFKDRTQRTYKVKVSDRDMKAISLRGTGAYAEIADKVVGELMQGYMQENYEAIRDMFYNSDVATGSIVNVATVAKDDYKAILLAIKNTVDGMTFVNDDFNKAGLKRGTAREDIRILMPYTIKNAIDVEELAGIFNLDKAEISDRIIVTDGADTKIFLLDVNAAQIYTYENSLESARNIDARNTVYNLFVDKLYALSPLFDCCSITLTSAAGKAPTQVEIVNDQAISVEVSNTTALDVFVSNTEDDPVNTKEVTEVVGE